MTGDWGYDLYILSVIGLLTLVSFMTRSVYFLFGDHLPLSEPVRRALRYAPTAALVAIIVPELLPWQSDVGPVFKVDVIAAVVAILVFMRTRSTVLIIVSGMVALWILQALF